MPDRAFGTDAGTGAAVNTVYGDDGLSIDQLYGIGRANILTRAASCACFIINTIRHITTVCNNKPCTRHCQ